MHNILLLTKVLLKGQFQGMVNATTMHGATKKKPSKGAKIATGVAYVVLFGYLIALFTFLFSGINTMAITYQLPQLSLMILLIMVLSIGLFMMVFAMVSTLYYDQTTSILLPLPLSATQILAARSIVLLIDVWMLVILLAIGPLLISTIQFGLTIVQFVLLVFMVFTICIIPSCILGILLMLIMRYSRIFYNKKRVQLIAFLLFFTIYFIFLNQLGSSTTAMDDASVSVTLLSTISQTIGSCYPPLRLALNTVMAPSFIDGLTKFMIYIGLTIATVWIYFKVGQTIYLKGLVASMLNGGKRKVSRVRDRLFQKHHPIYGYIQKELHTIFSSATFIIQMVAPVYLLTGIMLVSIGIGITQGETDLFELITMLRCLGIDQWIAFMICAFVLFIASMDYCAGVMISKDGQCASWMRTIPMSALDQSIAKLITAMLIRKPLILLACVVAPLFQVVEPLSALTMFFILVAHMVVCDVFGLWNDARKPYLNWTSEIQAVKNNTKVFVGGLFNLLAALIFGGVYYLLLSMISKRLMVETMMILLATVIIVLTLLIQRKVGSHLLDAVH